MKFKCDCKLHIMTVDKRPLTFIDGSKEDYIGFTIYEHRSGKTGKKYKKPRELGTVVLIAEEAKKFKKWIKNEV